jgi:hypothetical protein
MTLDLQAIKDANTKILNAVSRAAAELRDLAAKVTNTVDPAELAAVAASLNAAADGLNVVVAEVDTDNSSPQI